MDDVMARFLAKVDRTASCWNWTAARNGQGYGRFSIDGRTLRAHRVAYMLWNDALDHGQVVRHTCDTPSCVKPEHLLVGQQAENVADRELRGRGRVPNNAGERHGRARLDEVAVREIRAAVGTGVSQGVLAERYGVSRGAIQHVVRRRSWRHIP